MIAHAKRYGLFALVAALFVIAIASGAWRHLSLHDLRDHRQALTAFVAAHPILSLGAYFGLYVVVVIACTPGPGAMSLAGGFLFGTWIGGAAALASCVVGSTIVFLACRTAFGDWAAQRTSPRIRAFQAGFSRNAFNYVLTLRLLPVMPLSATTIAAGLGGAPLSALVLGTLIGSAPVSFIFAGLGAGLGELFNHGQKIDMSLFERPQIVLPLVGLTLMSAAPLVWRLSRRARG
jgi:uncharacterized membrane protein YdjX (TVP38/TMEM64 family)